MSQEQRTVLRRGMTVIYDTGAWKAQGVLVQSLPEHGLWVIAPDPNAGLPIISWPVEVWRATQEAWVPVVGHDDGKELRERVRACCQALKDHPEIMQGPAPRPRDGHAERITTAQHAHRLMVYKDAAGKIVGCKMVENAMMALQPQPVDRRSSIEAAMTVEEWRACVRRLASMGLILEGLKAWLDVSSTRNLARMSLPVGHKHHRVVPQRTADGCRDLIGHLATLDHEARAAKIKSLNEQGQASDTRLNYQRRDKSQ